jgi:hybrid polyketide synthase / nonribosomal peptide synthetase ACE1
MQYDGSKLELIYDTSLASKLSISQRLCTTSEVLVKVSYSILTQVVSAPDSIYCILGMNMATGKTVIAFSTGNSSFVFVPQERAIEYSLPAFKEVHLLSVLELHLKTERILSSCDPNSTLIAHEPSPELAAMLLAYASDTSIDVFFTTTRSEAVKRRWITLHAASSIRTINSLLPSHVSTFLDCSVSFPDERVGAIVASCLPATCHRRTMAQIETHAHARRPSPTELTATLTKAAHRALADVLKSQLSDSSTSISLRKLVQMDALLSKSTIADWTDSVSIPVTTSTVESQIHFKGDRTYVMFGLTSDLAQSTCDWMVSHGARNLVLTSRAPNIDIRWVELLRETGVRVEVVAKSVITSINTKTMLTW